jgi:hypothetical protein
MSTDKNINNHTAYFNKVFVQCFAVAINDIQVFRKVESAEAAATCAIVCAKVK